jgi:nitroimidazol reductase NimA-like FMN-containing flavoprotein (pyridoxamine 5'-phosphate oxidase superfamily)
MTLATVSEDGKPHATVLLYVIDDDFNIYFVSHPDSKKVRHVGQNSAVSLSVWEHRDMSVQVNGEAEPVEDPEKVDALLSELAEAGMAEDDDHFYPPVLRMSGEEYAVFRVRPTAVRCLDLVGDEIKSPGSPFTDIEF